MMKKKILTYFLLSITGGNVWAQTANNWITVYENSYGKFEIMLQVHEVRKSEWKSIVFKKSTFPESVSFSLYTKGGVEAVWLSNGKMKDVGEQLLSWGAILERERNQVLESNVTDLVSFKGIKIERLTIGNCKIYKNYQKIGDYSPKFKENQSTSNVLLDEDESNKEEQQRIERERLAYVKKEERNTIQNSLRSDISTVKNIRDKEDLEMDLAKIDPNSEDNVDMQQELLKEKIKKVKLYEKMANDEIIISEEIFNRMSQDHKERQGPQDNIKVLNSIKNDNSLTAAQKHQMIKELQEKLRENENNLLQDDANKSALQVKINENKINNNEALTSAIALGGLATGAATSFANRDLTAKNLYQGASSFRIGVQVGIDFVSIPSQLNEKINIISNDGSGNNKAQVTKKENKIAHAYGALGIAGRFEISPFYNEYFTINAFGQYSFCFLGSDAIFGFLGALNGNSNSGNTNSSGSYNSYSGTATHEYSEHTNISLSKLEYGLNGSLGGKKVKLLYEIAMQKYSLAVSYTSSSLLKLTNGSYSSIETLTTMPSSVGIVNTRLMGGIRFGSYSNSDSNPFDILFGQDSPKWSTGESKTTLIVGVNTSIIRHFSCRLLYANKYYKSPIGSSDMWEVSIKGYLDRFWRLKK